MCFEPFRCWQQNDADCFGFVIQVNFMSAQMIAASSGKKDDTAGKLNFLFYTLQPALEVEDHPYNSTLCNHLLKTTLTILHFATISWRPPLEFYTLQPSLEDHPNNSTLCNHLLKTTRTILHFATIS